MYTRPPVRISAGQGVLYDSVYTKLKMTYDSVYTGAPVRFYKASEEKAQLCDWCDQKFQRNFLFPAVPSSCLMDVLHNQNFVKIKINLLKKPGVALERFVI